MQKISRKLINKIGQKKFPAAYLAVFVKIKEHGVGGHARKKSSGKGSTALPAQVAEPKKRGCKGCQIAGPSGKLDDLADHESKGNENDKPGQWPHKPFEYVMRGQILRQHCA